MWDDTISSNKLISMFLVLIILEDNVEDRCWKRIKMPSFYLIHDFVHPQL